MKHNSKKCIKILLVLTDVDGVLTDGGRYYSAKGEISKKFHTRDGMGVNLLLRNGIKTVIITKEKSLIVRFSRSNNLIWDNVLPYVLSCISCCGPFTYYMLH